MAAPLFLSVGVAGEIDRGRHLIRDFYWCHALFFVSGRELKVTLELDMAYSGEDSPMSVVDMYVDAAVKTSKAVDYGVKASACTGTADNYYYAETLADDGS